MANLREIVLENDFVLMDTCTFGGHCDDRISAKGQIKCLKKVVELIELTGELIGEGHPLHISDGVEREFEDYKVMMGGNSTSYRVASREGKKLIDASREYGIAMKRLLLKFRDNDRIISLTSEDRLISPPLGESIQRYCRNISRTDSDLLYISALSAFNGNSTAILTKDSGIKTGWYGILFESETVSDSDLKFYWATSPNNFERRYHKKFHSNKK